MSVAADGTSVTDGITVTPAEHPSNRGRNEANTKMRIVKQYTTHTTGVKGLDFGLRIPAGANFSAKFTAAYEGNEKRTCNTAVEIILHGRRSWCFPCKLGVQDGAQPMPRALIIGARGAVYSHCSTRPGVARSSGCKEAVRKEGRSASGIYKRWLALVVRAPWSLAVVIMISLKRIAPVSTWGEFSSADVRVGITEKENGLEVRGRERNAAEPRGKMCHAAHGRRRRRITARYQ
ncbi:hypothetical protein C8R44DRAFT_754536 [Mycena epipterygia]|nr:hypothetical protein C8R44DRAFT_754536 [Mycena epipterygia]